MKDSSLMTKRRQLVHLHEPRPCFGCTWCGPQPTKGNDAVNVLCPTCEWLKGVCWFQWYQERANKIVFVNDSGEKHTSVRAFLKGSTHSVGERMERMSPTQRSTLFGKLYIYIWGNRWYQHSPEKRKERQSGSCVFEWQERAARKWKYWTCKEVSPYRQDQTIAVKKKTWHVFWFVWGQERETHK